MNPSTLAATDTVMSVAAGAAVAVAVAIAVLAAGVYLTAVLDQPRTRRHALALDWAGPVQRAALLVLQTRTTTERPDRELWALAGPLLGMLAASTILIVPLGATSLVESVDGIVYYGAAMALVMVAVFFNGWAPNSVLPLMGGYRFVALALSYEMPLALVLIGAALPAESLSLTDIAAAQHDLWNVVQQPLALPIFLIVGLGLAFWGPLAAPDAPELAGGTRAELSGAALLVWEWSRYAVLFSFCLTAVAAFLGGGEGPLLPAPLWVAVKTLVLLILLVAAGHRLPRIRLETFVLRAWSVLIPLALLSVLQGALVALVRA